MEIAVFAILGIALWSIPRCEEPSVRRGIVKFGGNEENDTMRMLTAIAFLAAAFASSTAFAQSSYIHHRFCLKAGGGQDCAYDSMAQCEAAKRGSADSCVPNGPPLNH